MSGSALDDRGLRDALEQLQRQARDLAELEERGFDLAEVRAADEAEVAALEAEQQQLVAKERAATQARDASADLLVRAMQGSDFQVGSLSKRERRWLMLLDGGQLVGTIAGFAAGGLVAALGLPPLALGVAAPLLVLLTGLVARRRVEPTG